MTTNLATMRTRVVVRDDAPMSEVALLQRLDKVQQALVRAGYPEVVGVPDPEDGAFHYEVQVPPAQRSMSRASQLARLPDAARASYVSVTFHEQSLGDTEAVYGPDP